jgi:hypothetical protein
MPSAPPATLAGIQNILVAIVLNALLENTRTFKAPKTASFATAANTRAQQAALAAILARIA